MTTTDIRSIHSLEFEGFYYVVTNDGVFGKGCSRCGGAGHYSFNGMDSICYKCGNVWEERLGDIFDTEAAAQKWCHERAVRRAQADRKREQKRLLLVAKMEAKQAALKAADPEVFAFVMSIELGDDMADEYDNSAKRDHNTFLIAMAENLRHVVNCDKPFTEKMVAATRRKMEQRVEKTAEAAAHPAPTGRVAVTGEIGSAKVVENEFGATVKILVKDDAGYKVWASLPSALSDRAFDDNYMYDMDGLKGLRITFSATLTVSDDDVSFAFGSRPTKGAWL